MVGVSPPAAARALPSWVAAPILVLQYLALSLGFDTQPLGLRSDGWRFVGNLGAAASWVLAAGCGMVLLGVLSERGRLRALLVARPLSAASLGWLSGHVVAFAGLWALSARIFAVAGPPSGNPLPWLAAWLVLALLSLAALLAAVVPAAQFFTLLRQAAPLLAGGALVGSGAWLAAHGSRLLWDPFGPWTLRGAVWLLRLVTPEVVTEGDAPIIGTPAFTVFVAPECAGFEGVGLMAAFVAFTLVLGRRQLRFPAALLLLPLGLLAAWILNLVRIVALILIGTHLSADVAVSGFHAKAGWLLFCALSLSLVIVARRSRWLSQQTETVGLGHPTAAFLMPFLMLLLASFLSGLLATHVDWLYGVRIAAALAALFAFRSYYSELRWPGRRALLTALGLGVLAFALFVGLSPRPEAEAQLGFHRQWSEAPLWLRALWLAPKVLGSVLVIPVAEELAFRGYLMRRLVARQFEDVPAALRSWPALLVSSLAFGAIHGGWLAGAAAGLLFGLAMWMGGNLLTAILAHAVANAAVAIYVLVFNQWWIWT
jgi:CAAX prenyl protease-like protein